MPAFAEGAGGMLTDEADRRAGRRIRRAGPSGAFRRRDSLRPIRRRPLATLTVEKRVYATLPNRVTAWTGGAVAKGSAITNDSFLALVSDQYLRTNVIAGRPNWAPPTGVVRCRAARCPGRKSRTS